MNLLKQQTPLIKKYWDLASEEISLFKNGDAVVGAAWPYQTSTLKAAGAKVADTIPSEGATGWADTWLLATKAPHPNCAYKWMAYISHAEGAGRAGRLLRRDAGQHAGLPDHGQAARRAPARRTTPTSRDAYFNIDQVLEDAARALRQRQERLRARSSSGYAWTQITG